MAQHRKPKVPDIVRAEARTPAEIAWAAGLFEGEGFFTTSRAQNGKYYGRATIGMTDEDVVRRFGYAVGFGYIIVEDRPTTSGKLMYRWNANGLQRAQALYAMFYPWPGKRRKQRGLEVLSLIYGQNKEAK